MRPAEISQTASEVRESLAGLGVHLHQEWIAHCLGDDGDNATSTSNGYGRISTEQAKEKVYNTFLSCDLREAGTGCIPAGVGDMAKERIQGKLVVQIEESRDIAKTFEQREKTDGGSSHHTLKLALGDGTQTVAAFEYRRIQGLSADPPPGLKLLLVEPWVRRGILLLSSENTIVLGGEISLLVKAREAARAGEKKKQDHSEAETIRNNGDGSDNHQPAVTAQVPGILRSSSRGDEIEGAVTASPRVGRGHGETPGVRLQQSQGLNSRPRSLNGKTHMNGSSADREQSRRDSNNSSPRLSRGSDRPGAPGQPSRTPVAGVVNPYAVARPPAANSRIAAASRNDPARVEGMDRGGASRQMDRQGEARAPALADGDDDGPDFEYLEEPEFDEPADYDSLAEQAQRENEREPTGGGRSGGVHARSSAEGVPIPPARPQALMTPAPETPRPKIVTAREQSDRLRTEELRAVRGRSEAGVGYMDCAAAGGSGGVFAGDEGRLQKKRGRTDSPAGGSVRSGPILPSPPRGPYTSLAELERVGPSVGAYRVKAMVADIKCCKIRKRKYLLGIEIEDGSGAMLVRLCDAMARNLFGMDARAFKKLAQTDPDEVAVIQTRVEENIREMEGVMEIEFLHAVAASQSPSAPETPGALMSQGSASGDSEWSLPTVMSVTPPTVTDCQDLLARAQAFF